MGIYGYFTNVQMSKCADMQMPFASITPITSIINYACLSADRGIYGYFKKALGFQFLASSLKKMDIFKKQIGETKRNDLMNTSEKTNTDVNNPNHTNIQNITQKPTKKPG